MRNYLATTLVMLTLWISFTSCSTEEPFPNPPVTERPQPPGNLDESGDNDNNENNNNNENNPMNSKITITAGSATFSVTLENNEAATAFRKLLPMTVNMNELNSNEKYCDLPNRLPTASTNPGNIRTGDLMLFGSSTLVLFYKSFSTGYSYTRLGRVDNPSELEAALGAGRVTVTFANNQ